MATPGRQRGSLEDVPAAERPTTQSEGLEGFGQALEGSWASTRVLPGFPRARGRQRWRAVERGEGSPVVPARGGRGW